MAAGSSSISSSVRVAVIGDAGTGKSTLIASLATDSFPHKVPPVIPPTRLPRDLYPDRVPFTIVDTSSRPEDKAKVEMECKKADAIVITYACNEPHTLGRLSTHWLPELRRIGAKVPLIVAGCKLDLRSDQQPGLEEMMMPIMHDFSEIETCIECSALKQIQVAEVFYYAQKAVLHPIAPLFDRETQTLKPRCVRALKRIFILCDHDRDGALNNSELNKFQVKCFNAPLQPSELVGIKKVVATKLPEGVNENGLTLEGFLFLHALFIEHGQLETTWSALQKFGYDDDIKLRDDILQNPSFKRAPDQSVELSEKGIDFLKDVFSAFDTDGDGALCPQEIDELFSTAPNSPWSNIDYDCMEKNAMGWITLNGFLSHWALMNLTDPLKSLAHLIYLGFSGDPATAFCVTRRRRHDRKKQQSQRSSLQCFVFGPLKAGKSTLLNALIGRSYADEYMHTNEERCTANIIDLTVGLKKVLVLREIPQEEFASLLQRKDTLASCDVAAFVYDSSDEASWKEAAKLLLAVAAHGENSGYAVPCLLIASKDDLGRHAASVSDSARVCQDMGVEAPISVSIKLGDVGNVFRRIVDAALNPHLSIPVTESGKSYQHYCRFVNHSLVFLSVGAAVAVVGIAAYRAYSIRQQSYN